MNASEQEKTHMKKTSLIVKEWFASKKATEMGRRFYNNGVFAILAKSEKAVKVLCASESCGKVSYWVPKSCLDISPFDQEKNEYNELHADASQIDEMLNTMPVKTYEEAVADYNEEMSWYR